MSIEDYLEDYGDDYERCQVCGAKKNPCTEDRRADKGGAYWLLDEIMNGYGDDPYLDFDGSPLEFADPGGKSALRAGDRIYPCPTCGEPNRLTAKDVKLKYQCDICSDAAEGGRFE